MKNIRAVFFDMDGLLLDTERIALSTFLEACRECQFEPDLRIYHRCIGTSYARAVETFRHEYGKDFPFEAVTRIWEEKFGAVTRDQPVPLKNGVLNLLHYLERKKIKRAVVTSSNHANAAGRLAKSGILHFFQFVLGGDQITRGKPDPEIYLTACRTIAEEPSTCLALEDSENGVLSAVRAGLKVVQIPDLVEPSPELKSLGHEIVDSLSAIERLFAKP